MINSDILSKKLIKSYFSINHLVYCCPKETKNVVFISDLNNFSIFSFRLTIKPTLWEYCSTLYISIFILLIKRKHFW